MRRLKEKNEKRDLYNLKIIPLDLGELICLISQTQKRELII